MNTSMLRSRRLRKLNKGAVRHMGWPEALGLKIAGRRDGQQGLPREDGDGRWTSPFVSREADSYEEFCSRMWSMLQLETESDFAKLNALTDSIPLTRRCIAEAEGALEQAEQEIIHFTRRKGEENLTEDQVHARRKREQERSMAPVVQQLRQLNEQLESQTAEFTALWCRLEEDANTIRMAVHRVREHTLQRLDIYWNAALRFHPEGMTMPVTPGAMLSGRSEEAYLALHRKLNEKAEAMRCSADPKEAA